MQSYNPAIHVFWRLMHFYTHLLLLLQPSVLWIMMQNHRQSEFCANFMYHESDPGQAGYPYILSILRNCTKKIYPLINCTNINLKCTLYN